MKHYFRIFACMALGFSVLACNQNEEKLIDNGHGNGNQVEGFAVGGVSSFETKSDAGSRRAVQTNRIALSEPGDPEQLYLIETVEDMDDSYSQENATKGTPVYTENFSSLIGNSFSAVAYKTTGGLFTGDDTYCSLTDGVYRFSGFPDGKWSKTEEEQTLVFFMGAPADINETDNTTLGYSNLSMNPTTKSIEFDYTSPESAVNQKDLLFTSKTVTRDEYVAVSKILFYHTLAGVKFKSGNAKRELDKTTGGGSVITDITKISLTNILSNGHCVVTPIGTYSGNDSNASGSVAKSAAVSLWGEITGEDNEYGTFTIDELSLVNSNKTLFPAATDFAGKTVTGNTDKQLDSLNLNASDYSKTFLFIPQTTGNNVVLSIEYTLNNKKYRKSVAFGGRTWEAGKIYTYTIEANHVSVRVVDQINGKVKSDVVMTNTGNVDVYLRAAIVGNWYDTHGVSTNTADVSKRTYFQIVAPWNSKDESQGEFTDLDKVKNWIYNEDDGFYYYKYKVKPGDTVKNPLFDKFTAGTVPSEFYTDASCHLEIDVLLQGVDASRKSDIEALWDIPSTYFSSDYDKVVN